MTEAPSPDIAAVIGRLELLEGFEAARSLLHDYGDIVDAKDAAGVAALFAVDGTLTSHRGVFRGRAEIEASYRLAWGEDPSAKRHFVAAPKLGAGAEPGLVVTASQFHFVARAIGRSVLGWGRYDDLIDVRGAEPVFAERRITLHLATDLVAGWAE